MSLAKPAGELRLSERGLDFVRRQEGFYPAPISLPDGRMLVGHGHAQTTRIDETLTPEAALALLEADLAPIERALHEAVLTHVTQGQYDALVSFAFSIGIEAFRTSDVLARLNAGQPIAAADALDGWRMSAIHGPAQTLDVLVRRRAQEKAMFLNGEAQLAAPSAWLKPAPVPPPPPIVLAPLPPPMATPPRTGEVERLTRILAAEPQTRPAVTAPPKPAAPPAMFDLDDADDPFDVIPAVAEPAPDHQGDWIAYGALGLLGVAMLGIGLSLFLEGRPNGSVALAILGAPGVIAMLMSLYYLLGPPRD